MAVDLDQYCRERKLYGFADTDSGSFSYGAVWDAKCVVPIPDGYDSVDAAPLMCAGSTVWTVLTKYGVRCDDRVAVMGIGGLGHLAIKIAAAMGCQVVVLSSSESKRDEAVEYGAAEYHVFKSGDEAPAGFKPVKHLLLCGSASVDYSRCVETFISITNDWSLTTAAWFLSWTRMASSTPLQPVSRQHQSP